MGRRRKDDDERCMIVSISLPPDCYRHAAEQYNFSGYIAGLIQEDMKLATYDECIICGCNFSGPSCPKCVKKVTKELFEQGIYSKENLNKRLMAMIEVARLERKERGVE